MRTVSREVQSVRQNGFNQDLSGREGRREGREAPSRAQMLVGAAEPEEARFLPTALVFLWEGGNKAAESADGKAVRGRGGRGGGTCQLLGARQQRESLS